MQSRQEFLRQAREKGQEAVELLRARLSIPVCDGEGRRACLSAIKTILCAIRQICEANVELKRIRETIEDEGYKTGRLPLAMFDIGGEWKDQYGGRVVGYRKDIAQAFRELEKETR